MATKEQKQAVGDPAESGRGLGLLSLVIGLLAGGGAYWIVDRWIDDASSPAPLAVVSLQSVITFCAGWLLLSERRDFLRPILPAALIAAVLAWPSWFLAAAAKAHGDEVDAFPFIFWFVVSGPLAFYLLLTLAKATLETGAPPKYAAVFFHGLTMPLVAAGAKLFAGLALVLLYAWAALLKQMDVKFFAELFDEPWFILPFLGAVGGLSIAMIRGQQAVLGALRFVLLLFSRIAMPIMAAFSATFLIVLALKGQGAILDADLFFGRPGGVILFLAFGGMLIFNGVYQNGESAPPPLWLRLATIVAIATFPVYTGLSFQALMARIGEYGLTPLRIGGLAMTGLAFAYSLVLIVGLLSELNWRARKWMPMVASLNTAMAALWVGVLVLLSSPLFNFWATSARSQERLLMSGDIAADEFDFGYLKFRLGADGEASLGRMEAASGHPQAAEIRAGVARARAALSYWEYQNPELSTPSSEATARETAQPGPMDLELDPDDAPATETETP
jgi:hypothetical protein